MLSRPWLVDGVLASAVIGAAVAAALAYGLNVLRHGRLRDDRLTRQGSSLLLGQWLMEAGYWSFRPVGRCLARWHVTPDTLSWGSLVSGIAAGVAVALGHLGWAAGAGAISAMLDALDGMVARSTGTASDAGEVLDAAVDRYVEFAFLGGCAVYLRGAPALLALALVALLGAFMVSYSTAKAEALSVDLPPGSMRRHTRAVYLTAGAALSAVLAGAPATGPWVGLPLTLALGLVAVVANASAARRLCLVARTVRGRDSLGPSRTGRSQVSRAADRSASRRSDRRAA